MFIVPLQRVNVRLGRGWYRNLRSMQRIVVPPVLKLFADSATDLEVVLRRNRHVARIEEAMDGAGALASMSGTSLICSSPSAGHFGRSAVSGTTMSSVPTCSSSAFGALMPSFRKLIVGHSLKRIATPSPRLDLRLRRLHVRLRGGGRGALDGAQALTTASPTVVSSAAPPFLPPV